MSSYTYAKLHICQATYMSSYIYVMLHASQAIHMQATNVKFAKAKSTYKILVISTFAGIFNLDFPGHRKRRKAKRRKREEEERQQREEEERRRKEEEENQRKEEAERRRNEEERRQYEEAEWKALKQRLKQTGKSLKKVITSNLVSMLKCVILSKMSSMYMRKHI